MSASYRNVQITGRYKTCTYRCCPFAAYCFYIGCATDIDFKVALGTTAGSDTCPGMKVLSEVIYTQINIISLGINCASSDVDDATFFRIMTTTYSRSSVYTVCLDIPPLMVIVSTVPL